MNKPHSPHHTSARHTKHSDKTRSLSKKNASVPGKTFHQTPHGHDHDPISPTPYDFSIEMQKKIIVFGSRDQAWMIAALRAFPKADLSLELAEQLYVRMKGWDVWGI